MKRLAQQLKDEHKLTIERDLFNILDLAAVQQQSKRGKCDNNIDNSTCKFTIAAQLPHLISTIGLSNTHVVKSKLTAMHQKGRRVPINLQPRVTIELDGLQKK